MNSLKMMYFKPIEDGDIPASYVSLPEGIFMNWFETTLSCDILVIVMCDLQLDRVMAWITKHFEPGTFLHILSRKKWSESRWQSITSQVV